MSVETNPEKTCVIESLVSHSRFVSLVLDGKKSAQRRNGVYGWVGETFDLEGQSFEITALYRQKLGDLTDQHAQEEGFPNLEAYKGLIMRMHKGMPWDAEALVWVHEFAPVAA